MTRRFWVSTSAHFYRIHLPAVPAGHLQIMRFLHCRPIGSRHQQLERGEWPVSISGLSVHASAYRLFAPALPSTWQHDVGRIAACVHHLLRLLARLQAGTMQLRELSGTVVVGQELPMLRVPAPTAREVK